MRLPIRIRKENPDQKYCIVSFVSAIGPVVAHTFLTEKEAAKYSKHGFDCKKIEHNQEAK